MHVMGTLGVPPTWDDVTPDFMTSVVAERYPGAEVAAVELLGGSDGTSSRARFALTYARGDGPATVFAKSQGDWEHRFVHVKTGNLYNEALLFASGVPLPVEHPEIYYSAIDRYALDEVIVMEDLEARDAVLHHATRPIGVDDVAAGLRGLARLHGEFWGMTPTSHRLGWIKRWAPTKRFRSAVVDYGRVGMQRMADLMPPSVAAQDVQEMAGWWERYVSTVGSGPVTLLHGDAHLGNTYRLPDGEVGFVDWAVVRRGHWVHDVGYFIVSSLTAEDRRAHEADLIEEYRRHLDVPETDRPSAAEAWLRYRSAPPYGLAVWLATGGGGGWRTPEICSSFVERFAAAFVDLDTPAALGELTAVAS